MVQKLYKQVSKLRNIVNSNNEIYSYYIMLKFMNIDDELYGWLFKDNAILEDTLEDLDIYEENYVICVLREYKRELEYIIHHITNKECLN